MILTWALAALVTVAALAAAACAVIARVSFRDGLEAGQLQERNRLNLRRLEGRTARAARRIWGAEPDDFGQWLAELADHSGAERLADTGEMQLLEQPAGTHRAIAGTGAFAALTDDFIARMEAEEEAFRKGIAS